MPTIDELVPTLANLSRREYAELIRQVDAQRRRAAERAAQKHRPPNEMSKDEFVDWIAAQHYAIDKGVDRIIYFPTGAPPKEVRLLEVNVLAPIPENAPVEAVDFMPDIDGVDYTLLVADVTPRQFSAISREMLALPSGWVWDGFREIPVADR